MIQKVTAIVVDTDSGFRKAVRQQLADVPNVELVGEAANLTAAHELLAKTHPRLVLLEVPARSEEALGWAEKWRLEYPGMRVFATSVSKSPESILTAFRAGVSEYLSKPLEVKELREAFERVVRELEIEAIQTRHAGQVTAVFSKKGGLGVTTLAVNLAVALAESGQQTVIADLAFDIGDVASQLDLRPEFVMGDILKDGEVDSGRLQASLLRHPSGLHYLGEKEVAGTSEGMTTRQLHQMLTHLRDAFQNVVLDLPHSFDSYTYEALQVADHILLVSTCEMSTIRSTKYALQVFRSLGYDERKVKIVLNRLSRKDAITEEQFSETVQYPVSYRIPSDYDAVVAAINSGEPLTLGKGKSKVGKSIHQLAQMLVSPNGSGPASDSRIR